MDEEKRTADRLRKEAKGRGHPSAAPIETFISLLSNTNENNFRHHQQDESRGTHCDPVVEWWPTCGQLTNLPQIALVEARVIGGSPLPHECCIHGSYSV